MRRNCIYLLYTIRVRVEGVQVGADGAREEDGLLRDDRQIPSDIV